jgi:hypothetical protein
MKNLSTGFLSGPKRSAHIHRHAAGANPFPCILPAGLISGGRQKVIYFRVPPILFLKHEEADASEG